MPKQARPYRGKSRWDDLVPAGRIRLGDRVWWSHTSWVAGYPSTYWQMGLVETKRNQTCVVRDRYGHTWEVEVGRLMKPETET